MADEPKHSWWKSVPGVLTAGTGFVAALSGLVAGLNQLGVFRREQPAPAVVVTAPAPRESMPQLSPGRVTAESVSSAGSAEVSGHRSSTAPTPAAPPTSRPSRPGSSPASSTPAAPRPTPPAGDAARTEAADSEPAGPARLPKGTAIELMVPARTCAPAAGWERFKGRLAAPVEVAGAAVLPAGTTAVLHLRRDRSSAAPEVRLDSLVRQGTALAIPPSSQLRIRRGAARGACLQTGARLSVTLGASVALPRR